MPRSSNERRFTADAAHELRTPLAALKVQAQIAMATKDAAQNRHALAQVVAGADRATRLVEQLLRLARLDPIVRLPAPRQLDLAELAKSLVADSHKHIKQLIGMGLVHSEKTGKDSILKTTDDFADYLGLSPERGNMKRQLSRLFKKLEEGIIKNKK